MYSYCVYRLVFVLPSQQNSNHTFLIFTNRCTKTNYLNILSNSNPNFIFQILSGAKDHIFSNLEPTRTGVIGTRLKSVTLLTHSGYRLLIVNQQVHNGAKNLVVYYVYFFFNFSANNFETKILDPIVTSVLFSGTKFDQDRTFKW